MGRLKGICGENHDDCEIAEPHDERKAEKSLARGILVKSSCLSLGQIAESIDQQLVRKCRTRGIAVVDLGDPSA